MRCAASPPPPATSPEQSTRKTINPDVLRDTLMRVGENDGLASLVDMVLHLVGTLDGELTELRQRLLRALRASYTRRSEKLDPNQLALFEQLAQQLVQAAGPKPESQPTPRPRGDKSRHAHGRGKLPTTLPREDNIISVEGKDRLCSECGGEKTCIGYATSERLEYTPATFKVIADKREKLACKTHSHAGVSIADAADKTLLRGLAGPGLLAHVLVSKIMDGLPLYQLHKIYRRSGVHLAESTLGDMMRTGADALQPLARLIEERALASAYLNVDDTGLMTLDREHPKGIKKGHIWVYIGERRWAVFRFTPDWKGKHPRTFLAGYKGLILGDGYAGLEPLFVVDDAAQKVGCMMHLRRYFFMAHKAGDKNAGIALSYVHHIYAVEHRASNANADAETRLHLRQQESWPWMEKLHALCLNLRPLAPPKTPLGKAVGYALNQWDSLLPPYKDGRLTLDNGEAERRLKLVAIGRRRWLFAGSDAGGERAAVALTVLVTALIAKLDPLAYLTDVFRRLAGGLRSSDLHLLLPDAWAKQQGQDVQAEQPAIPDFVR